MRGSSWTSFVASRWFLRSRGETGPSLAPSTAGIAVGVAALLCVIGVMNGFQLSFIDAVLDLDSYHLRIPSDSADIDAIRKALPDSETIMPFVDVRTMMSNAQGKATALRIKIIPDEAFMVDPAMASRIELRSGERTGGLLIGSVLSRSLNLRVGDTVSVLHVSADIELGIETRMVDIHVAGIYHSGYYDYDAALAFLNESSSHQLASGEIPILGIRLHDRYDDARALASLSRAGIVGAQSWREYNRAFFGALRMEKSVMMMLVGLIFLVVGVNIFHSMRKAVYGRVEDIATMKALGSGSKDIRGIFMLDGMIAGLGGASLGLFLGLLVAMNVNAVFSGIETVVAFMYTVLGRSGSGFQFFSPDLFYIGDVPVRLSFPETFFIFAAGAFSALAAAWAASSRVSRILPSEVLRDE
ncbi:ABC transporter permease [Spirochaetota bacterium]